MPSAGWPIMPESMSVPQKPKPTRSGSDKDALDQVERWMAVIRELVRDQVTS